MNRQTLQNFSKDLFGDDPKNESSQNQFKTVRLWISTTKQDRNRWPWIMPFDSKERP